MLQKETNIFPWPGTEEMDVNNLISGYIINGSMTGLRKMKAVRIVPWLGI